jgi:hypothetical protein
MGLAPSREDLSRWDVPPPPPGATSASGADPKRRKRSEAFEGDTALRELRTRLAAVPEDQAPEPPLAPPKSPIFASMARLMGVMVLAAAGALGFLWITSPHGSPVANQEATLVSLRGFEPQTRSAAPVAKPLPAAQEAVADPAPEPAPPSTADKPWAVANYTNDMTERSMAPGGLSPRVSGPPRGPVVNRVVVAPPPQPAPVAAPAPVVPPPAPTFAAPPAPPVAAPAPDRDEIAALLVRARTYLAAGDVAAARLVLRRAAERDDPQAALALGGTYDPTVLKRLGIISFHADPSQARDWYRKAAALGSADASLRLEQLADR